MKLWIGVAVIACAFTTVCWVGSFESALLIGQWQGKRATCQSLWNSVDNGTLPLNALQDTTCSQRPT